MPTKKRTKNAAAPPPEWVTITLRTDTGDEYSFQSSRWLQQIAMKWRAVVRNRRRWAGAQEAKAAQAAQATEDVKKRLGVNEQLLARLAAAQIIEISVPWRAGADAQASEEIGWEARVLPWEYLLSAATKKYRGEQPFTVIRQLDCGRPAAVPPPTNLLYVESAPGMPRGQFDFETERELMRASLTLPSTLSRDERRDQLLDHLRELQPGVIHWSGVDTKQGANLGVWKPADEKVIDGALMKGVAGSIDAVDALALAQMLNAGERKPLLVACNLFNSAARLAALAVAHGAEAAIGFQDEFDYGLAELFFTNFYQAWRLSEWNHHDAFLLACQALRKERRGLSGTGVVLWSNRSLLGAGEKGARATATLSALTRDRVERRLRAEKERVIRPDDPEMADEVAARDLLRLRVKPSETLNYSMLHNNRALFDDFRIRKTKLERVNNVDVTVTLSVGEQQAAYAATWDVTDSVLDLRDEIRLPLISAAWATIGESAHTTLTVGVKWGRHELYRRTHRVTLLTPDEWRDDEANRVWLPSFVLPRDPLVRRIVDDGQRYLMAICDDGQAAFDGYQSFAQAQADDPEAAAENVDAQARAIWAAIVYDHHLSYTNPPPTFTNMSQRLRSPSELMEARRATCIDTSLLLAACLELVEIHPVLFLLAGHAFVGYWRGEDYRDQFFREVEAEQLLDEEPGERDYTPDEAMRGVAYQPAYAWYFEARFYAAIVRQVRAGRLIPLESTLLTQRGGFWEAVDAGVENLSGASEFQSMLDLRRARENRVTPLPMRR